MKVKPPMAGRALHEDLLQRDPGIHWAACLTRCKTPLVGRLYPMMYRERAFKITSPDSNATPRLRNQVKAAWKGLKSSARVSAVDTFRLA